MTPIEDARPPAGDPPQGKPHPERAPSAPNPLEPEMQEVRQAMMRAVTDLDRFSRAVRRATEAIERMAEESDK